MPNSQLVNINLICKPKQAFRESFLKWAVNVGRVIIITTELIALSALLYRFTIDRKIIDLHDQIKRAEIFVKNQQAKENDYVSIQRRLENIKKTQAEAETKIALINDILASVSQGSFSSTNITVNQNSININGFAFSIFQLNNFIENLKGNPNITSISLDDVSSVNEGIQFKLRIELKENKST